MLFGVAPLNESTRPRVLIAYEAGWQHELKLERGTIRRCGRVIENIIP